jgi:hypothetical protein
MYSTSMKGLFRVHVLGVFFYDKKGPCHIWRVKSAQAKKEATKVINQWNAENEARFREK